VGNSIFNIWEEEVHWFLLKFMGDYSSEKADVNCSLVVMVMSLKYLHRSRKYSINTENVGPAIGIASAILDSMWECMNINQKIITI